MLISCAAAESDGGAQQEEEHVVLRCWAGGEAAPVPVRLPAACVSRVARLLGLLGPRRLLYLAGLRCTAGSLARAPHCPPAR